MKKIIYLTILTIITIICIIAGVFYHVVGRFSRSWKDNFEYVKSGDAVDMTEQLTAFDSIEMDISAAEVVIGYGDAYAISFEGAEQLKPIAEVNGNVLTVHQASNRIKLGTNVEGTITLTIPQGTELKRVILDVDAGTINLTQLTADLLEVDVDAGNVEVYGGTINKSSFDMDAGNVSLNDCQLVTTEANADMGNIEYNSCVFTRLAATADLGNVEVHSPVDLSDYKMDINVDLGNLEVNKYTHTGHFTNAGTADKELSVTVNLGNATVTYE